ncbi:hypothetical protein BGZ54_003017 [Gamsiella multidivaricata]|nr:hypothetical protein BGZ54_003017 [Gamsiella multidivaricata]
MPTDPDHHHELMMLKREAFQELASQTQRFDDLFIAKMIYWESLGNEEKAQWLERGHHHHRHTPSNHLQSHEQQSCQDMEEEVESSMEQDEIDDLVNALECRATCKDYSALLDFEREAAAERRRQTVGERDQLHDTSAVKMQDPLTCWDLGYEDVF